MRRKLTEARQYTPCGGCGAKTPEERCIGCLHPFSEDAAPEGAGDAEPVAWLLYHDGKLQPALTVDSPEGLAARRSSFPYMTVTPVVPASSLQSRNQELVAEVERLTKTIVAAWNAFGPSGKRSDPPAFDADDLDHLPRSAYGDLDVQIRALEDRAEAAEAQASSLKQQLDERDEAMLPFALMFAEMRDNGRPDDKKVYGYNNATLLRGDFRRVHELLHSRTTTTPTNGDSHGS